MTVTLNLDEQEVGAVLRAVRTQKIKHAARKGFWNRVVSGKERSFDPEKGKQELADAVKAYTEAEAVRQKVLAALKVTNSTVPTATTPTPDATPSTSVAPVVTNPTPNVTNITFPSSPSTGKKVRYVVAGNEQEFDAFVAKKGYAAGEAVYVSDASVIANVKPSLREVDLVGTYYLRSDFMNICDNITLKDN
jgi:hypothetical protein